MLVQMKVDIEQSFLESKWKRDSHAFFPTRLPFNIRDENILVFILPQSKTPMTRNDGAES
jgi:hypothetical protein